MSQTPIHQVFKALGDPTRFGLVQLLMTRQGICVSELAEKVDVSVAGVSQQLKFLEQCGVIERTRDGQRICYQLRQDDPNVQQALKLVKNQA